MQGTRVRCLVREDPTCRRATKPVCHNNWACALEPTSHNYWACAPQLLKPARLEPVLRNKRSHHNEKPAHRNKEQHPRPDLCRNQRFFRTWLLSSADAGLDFSCSISSLQPTLLASDWPPQSELALASPSCYWRQWFLYTVRLPRFVSSLKSRGDSIGNQGPLCSPEWRVFPPIPGLVPILGAPKCTVIPPLRLSSWWIYCAVLNTSHPQSCLPILSSFQKSEQMASICLNSWWNLNANKIGYPK